MIDHRRRAPSCNFSERIGRTPSGDKYRMVTPARALLVATLVTLALQSAHAGPITVDGAELTRLRNLLEKDSGAANEFAKLRSFADSALKDSPTPIERVISEGTLASDPGKKASNEAMRDVRRIESLAWVAAVTGDDRYAAKARQFIVAWAKRNKPDGNPINETKFEPLVEAYDLTREGFPPADRAIVDNWLKSKAQALWADSRVRRENWESHRIKMVGLIGLATHDAALWNTAHTAFRRQMDENFEPNGESVDFKRRDAMHYHLYAVEPLLVLACAAQHKGENLFVYEAPDGVTLEKALDFVIPYANGTKQHIEFVNSKVDFDRKRAAAGETTYANHKWNPQESIGTFAEGGCLDGKYDKLAVSLSDNPNRRYQSWKMVVNRVVRDR